MNFKNNKIKMNFAGRLYPRYEGTCNGCGIFNRMIGIYHFPGHRTYYFCIDCFYTHSQPFLQDDYIPNNRRVPNLTHDRRGNRIVLDR